MQIHGTVTIAVDEVDIEQIEITKPALVRGMTVTLKAAAAAREHADFVTLWRVLRKHCQTLEYYYANKIGDVWEVVFRVREKTAEELAA